MVIYFGYSIRNSYEREWKRSQLWFLPCIELNKKPKKKAPVGPNSNETADEATASHTTWCQQQLRPINWVLLLCHKECFPFRDYLTWNFLNLKLSRLSWRDFKSFHRSYDVSRARNCVCLKVCHLKKFSKIFDDVVLVPPVRSEIFKSGVALKHHEIASFVRT